MTNKLIQAAQAALDALACTSETADPGHRCGHCDDYVDRNAPVRHALRKAIGHAGEKKHLVGCGDATNHAEAPIQRSKQAQEIDGYVVIGYDASGKLVSKILHFTIEEARESAAVFAKHYPQVITKALMISPGQPASAQPAQPLTAEQVFKAIEHGDTEHRAWLLAALYALWDGLPVPAQY
jgi:hypothetical protein